MLRRRRPVRQNELFGFDSFLDIVANVIGIIIRLILVSWVGARSYTAAMTWVAPAVAPLPTPQVRDDPLSPELARLRGEMDALQARLRGHLDELGLVAKSSAAARAEAAENASRKRLLDAAAATLSAQRRARQAARDAEARQTALSLDELRQRGMQLRQEMQAVESQPRTKRALRYHAPLSQEVRGDELMFECRAGRLTYIDLPRFLQEARLEMDRSGNALKSQWSVSHVTAPSGAFRLRYTIEREKDAFDAAAGGLPGSGAFRYGLSEWVLEPLAEPRGEASDAALATGSKFRQLTDRVDSRLTAITVWVAPDAESFALFRRLRDHLHERGVEVACRPLPSRETPIAASRHGTASRAQ